MAETLRDWIETRLRQELAPTQLDVTDESHLHAGHAGARPGGETHYRLDIVSAAFEGKSRVDRHRLVNGLMEPAFARGLHALALRARSPAEAG
jgi:BolA family transcriptional regulator, general stress-responsive regulator